MNDAGLHIEIRGTVQGVGFRPWVYRIAREKGLRGFVRNDSAGVTIEAFGPAATLVAFRHHLRKAPAAARVRSVRSEWIAASETADFVIAPSLSRCERRVSIPADLATCDDCAREIFDPEDRRNHHAFANCTSCGPRFTIATQAPYDRSRTTMAAFEPCPVCRGEYADPRDRRFHAEPIACPGCGPRLELLGADGRALPCHQPLHSAARALARGRVVAIKGLGGYHLACDATSDAAVARLRRRKRREAKPFAVMVRDLAAAREIAMLDPTEAQLLTSPERPIVLVQPHVRAPTPIASGVAPGLPLLGLLLPYTPLHHLLLHEVGRPLVMTSGNRPGEPIAFRDGEARARLCGIADRFLTHDRPIATRCDDSVARVVSGRPTLLRRSRGWVPRPIPLRRRVEQPVLACGGHLKNTICLAVGNAAFLGPHVGDLESLESLEGLAEAAERMQRLVGVRPELFACDLHPGYHSTRYARERAGEEVIGVQHHHAHVASALAEHRLEGPVLGLAWDGTGLGDDGALWGGELLLADTAGFERLGTFRPIALAGGDRAMREVWRIALAVLLDAFDGDPPLPRLGLFAGVAAAPLRAARSMLERGVNTPPAHGVGRLFDAVGSLVLGRRHSRYEGEVALAWNLAAERRRRPPYPIELDGDARVDWRPLVRSVVRDLLSGVDSARISARFHASLAHAALLLVRHAARRVGRHPVVLSGGCFQNARLVEETTARLRGEFELVLHSEVPPGDGGLALGQAVVAASVAAGQGRRR